MKFAIYGISGSGKTFLSKSIENSDKRFKFFEGSKIIETITEGGLIQFKKMKDDDKNIIRKKLLEYILIESSKYENVIVDGHFSFFKNSSFEIAFTESDRLFYDHFFYLDFTPEIIKERQVNDIERIRDFSINDIKTWIDFEKEQLKLIFKDTNKLHFLNSENTEKNIIDFLRIVSNGK